MKAILCVIAVLAFASAAFDDQSDHGENIQMHRMIRQTIDAIAEQRGLSLEDARQAYREEIASAPAHLLQGVDRVEMDKNIRFASLASVSAEGALSFGSLTPSKTFGSDFYYYSFTVPATGNVIISLGAATTFNTAHYGGVMFNLGRVPHDEYDRFNSQWFWQLSAVSFPLTLPACSLEPYRSMTGYIWFYRPAIVSPSNGWPAFQFQVTTATETCTTMSYPATGTVTSWNVANFTIATANVYSYAKITYTSTASMKVTFTTSPASAATNFVVCGEGCAPGSGSPAGVITSAASVTLTIGVRSANLGAVTVWMTTTPYVCTTLNIALVNSTCPQLTNNMKYSRISTDVTSTLRSLDAQAYILGGGACATGVQRTLGCTALFPKCDDNNFLLPICPSVCSDYFACSGYENQDKCMGYMNYQLGDEQDNDRSQSNTLFNRLYLRPAAASNTNCWRYPFNSASVAAPSILFVVLAVAAALLA